MNEHRQHQITALITGIGLLFVVIHIIGMLYPDRWWSVHFLAFLHPFWKVFFIVLPTLFILGSSQWFQEKANSFLKPKFQKLSTVVILCTTALSVLLFYLFPITFDFYGEAYLLENLLPKPLDHIPQKSKSDLFSFGLSPWDGQDTIFAILNYITYYAGWTFRDTFIAFNLFFGTLYVMAWLFFIRYYLHDFFWQVIMAVGVLMAPMMLNYYGHIEIYAPILLFNSLWSIAFLVYFRTKKARWFWAALIMQIICLKFHPIAVLFLPATGLLCLYHWAGKAERIKRLLTWKGVTKWIVVPIFALGGFAYFFILGDHNDPRHLQISAKEYDRLFLPIVSPHAPLDRYNLLSINHIFDYFSEVLVWSLPLLFLGIVLSLFYGKYIKWKSPEVLLTALTLLLTASLFFVVNPLLAMQKEWDLFGLPCTVMYTLVIVMVQQASGPTKIHKKAGMVAIALALFFIPQVMVLSSVPAHSKRAESVGIGIFKTYYEWSARTIHHSLKMIGEDEALYDRRKEALLKKLRPYAIPGIDYEYARLVSEEGRYYLREKKNYKKALKYLNEAYSFYPDDGLNLLYLIEWNFENNKMADAYYYSLELIEVEHPDDKRALSIAVHCALEAGFYDRALEHSSEYIKKYPTDKPNAILEVNKRLLRNDRVEELKYLFDRKNAAAP